MKPALEHIDPVFGSSFKILKFTEENHVGNPYWHFHPEYEIVYIGNGKGKRHVGDHISYFDDGQFIFLGPNIPHFGFTETPQEGYVEIVIQMRADFLGESFWQIPEMQAVHTLFERSHRGLLFHGKTKQEMGAKLEAMAEMPPFQRLVELLQVLQFLAQSTESESMQLNGPVLEVGTRDMDRMQAIYNYIYEHYAMEVSLDVAARMISMTVPAFCRYFKKITSKTFTEFVNEFRVTQACRMLSDKDVSIAEASFECGFNNLSHFNKQFRKTTGQSPREFRAATRHTVFRSSNS